MSKFIDLTGKTFGKLTVIKREENNIRNHSMWKCKCECGKTTISCGDDLRSGKSKSCGYCIKKIEYGDATFNRLVNIYKSNAKKAKREYSLADEDVKKLISSNCHYCNTSPSQIIKSKCDNGDLIYTGIDRIDNTKGYTLDNVYPCCEICNFMKHKKTEREFLLLMKAIYENLNLGGENNGKN